jgi:anaerobic selenocysteine-containing dehydrogenase
MSTTQSVHASISSTQLALNGTDLPTICVLCSHNCGIRVDVADGRIIEIRGDERNPITTGYLCNKAFGIPNYVEHAQRVHYPLRRRADGSFERISWDVAISEIAAKLQAIRNEYSPRAIGLVGIGGQGNHMDAPYGISFLRALGSRKWFNAFAQEKTQHSLLDQWMFNLAPTVWLHPDQEHAQFMLVLGTNPRISNRGHNANETFRAFVADPKRKLVVVDPRETETTRQASQHVRVRPGSDAYLLLALAATIVKNELVDYEFVRNHTAQFTALAEALATVDIETMAERSGVAASAITEIATEFARAEAAAIFYDLGVEQAPFSTLNSYVIRVLLALTGNLGNRGGNIFLESLLPPALDQERVREPERALASGIPAIRAMGNMGMFSPTLCPEEVLVDHPEHLRAIIVEGSNPILSFSDAARWREARDRLDLLVVIDPAMTETAHLADYVLPTPVGYEKWEIASFPKGYPEIYVQVRPPVVPAPGEALPEPEIYTRLVEAMQLCGPIPEELHALAPAALEPEGGALFIATAQQHAAQNGGAVRDPAIPVLFWAYRTLGRHLAAPPLVAVWLQCGLNAMLRPATLLRTLGPEWEGKAPFEIAAELFRRIMDHPEGVEIGRVDAETNFDDHIGFDDKRVQLAPPAMLDELRRAVNTPAAVDTAFPFVLAAGLRTRWTANTIQRDPSWRKGRGPHCALNLSPTDAQRLGVREGDALRVTTRRGALTLPAHLDPALQVGHVWMPNGFGMVSYENGKTRVDGGNQNELTDVNDRDPFTGIPHHRYVQCQLEKIA